ncbi:glycoside hydrolase family 27 protein [Fumia xinanensis]|uniref:Alpha-galactosidase n=1 Tax=Fumia xinanensis TaxID=2763659 RepID=A0A926I719_9FIRM|nr:glycoside hydrolase family 27 protein [Fumia xinanensis]MBC8560505.1 glycoside hydrolase family 27 protein [Fumia xinanensis]
MLAKTPPMGWNSWNTFGTNINEQLIIETADVMANEGFLEAGYEYLVIDDCWSLRERDENGLLVADPEKFPHGMKYVADYVHSKGLKFGMYSCAGIWTCAGYPSSFDHEYLDAQTFADWGVDFLKYDFCNFPATADCKHRYHRMSMALKATGRDILFSACNWGVEEPWKWMKSIGAHMYRSTGDIRDNYESFKEIALSQLDNLPYSSSGSFNDPDMLVVGMYGKGNVGFGGCTDEEYQTHFALWCMFGVPLMMGGDMRDMSEASRKLLLNKDLIAINQDEECRAPVVIRQTGDPFIQNNCVLFRHLSNGEFALAFFNFNEESEYAVETYGFSFDDIGIPFECGYGLELTDVFTGENMGVKREAFIPPVKAHSCKVYRGKLVKVDEKA